jgi:hypothetical protein
MEAYGKLFGIFTSVRCGVCWLLSTLPSFLQYRYMPVAASIFSIGVDLIAPVTTHNATFWTMEGMLV